MEQDGQNTAVQSSYGAPKSHRHTLLWIIMVLLTLAGIGAAYGAYIWQRQKTVAVQQALDSANNKIADLETKQELYALPTRDEFSPQCETRDNSDLIVAALTPEPVNKYQAYVIKCANKMSIPSRVVAFQVREDGSRSFAFGAGTGEPFCVSNKIINAESAIEISRKTAVPICKTF